MGNSETRSAVEPASGFAGTARFVVERALARGGMGVVYQAFDRERGIRVALKTMIDVNPDSIARFKQEFRALADVSHPNLVTLHELVFADGHWFFTMELLDGIDFLSYVRGQAPAPPATTDRYEPPATAGTVTHTPWSGAEATTTMPLGAAHDAQLPDLAPAPPAPPVDLDRLRAVLPQLVSGVCALHDSGHLHRDIKPSNVIVTRSGRCVLVDFGVITELAASARSTTIVGTPAYMAPEQLTGERVPDAASDWYSVGVMLYEALTGWRPFRGTPSQIVQAKHTADPPPAHTHRSDIPADLDELVSALLRRDPDERPRAAELRRRVHVAEPLGRRAPRRELFVGRNHQLAALVDAFGESRSQRVALLVHGAPGMGKTALIEQFLATAMSSDDALVLTGRCYEQESVPYKAVDSLIDDLSRFLCKQPAELVRALIPADVAALATTFPTLLEVPAIAAARDAQPVTADRDPVDTRKRAFAGLRALIAAVGARRRLILFIDDLHWGDTDSAPLLADLIDDHSSPLLLLATYRTTEAETSPLFHALFAPHGRDHQVRRIELSQLSLDDARSLAETLLAYAGVGPGAAQRIARESHGNAYFIHELVEYMAAHALGSSTVPDGQALTLDRAILERLAASPAESRRVHEIVCAAGRPIACTVLHLAADLSPEDAGVLAHLESVRLVRSVRGGAMVEPFHDRVREITVGHLDAPTLVELHGRLARAFEACDPDDLEALATHHSAAGHRTQAHAYAIRAGEQAERALAFGRAAALYQLALDQADPTADRRQLHYALARALRNAGRGADAADAFLAAAETDDPLARIECRGAAAEQLLISGRVDRGLEVLRELLRELGTPLADSRRRVLLSILWHRARIRLHGARWTTVDAAAVAPDLVARSEIYRIASRGLVMVDNFRAFDFQARGLLLALQIGEPTRIARELALEAIYVASAGRKRFARAEALHALSGELAARCGAPHLASWNVFCAGMLDYWAGRFQVGANRLLEAKAMFASHMQGLWWETTTSALFAVFCLRHQGALRALRALFDEHVRDARARDDLYTQTAFRRWTSIVWLGADRVAYARTNVDETHWPRTRDGEHNTQTWAELHARGEIAVYADEADAFLTTGEAEFRALFRSPIARSQVPRCVALGLHARLLLAARDPATRSHRRARVAAFARRLEAEDLGFAHVFAALIRAALTDDADQRIGHLRRTIEHADAHGMAAHRAVAERRLGQLLGGSAGATLIASSNTWMGAEEIANVDRFATLFAPRLEPDAAS